MSLATRVLRRFLGSAPESITEEAYFDAGDGGVSFRIFEHEGSVGSEGRFSKTWRFETTLRHFGSGITTSFPLANPAMIDWLMQAFARTSGRMQGLVSDPKFVGFEFIFRDRRAPRVKVQDGKTIEARAKTAYDSDEAELTKSFPTEEAYFHGSNGGMKIRVIEEKRAYEGGRSDKTKEPSFANKTVGKRVLLWKKWRLEVEFSHLASHTTVSFPLTNPKMVKWLMEVLGRTVKRMEVFSTFPEAEFEMGFDDFNAEILVRDTFPIPDPKRQTVHVEELRDGFIETVETKLY